MALCLSGLILVFEPELRRFEEGKNTRVEPSANRLDVGELAATIEKQTGGNLAYLTFPQEQDVTNLAATTDGLFHFVDPYRGTILRSTERPAVIMTAIRVFHVSFFAGEIGTWVAIISSCFLIFLCVTGCYLFLKRNITTRKKFSIRWGNARRRTYDLHAVAGFITAVPIALISLSGALIGLGQAWTKTILFLTDSEFKVRPTLNVPVDRSGWDFNFEELLKSGVDAAPEGMYVDSMVLPTNPEEPIRLRLLYEYATRPASWAFFNPAGGALIEFHHHWEYSTGHLIHRLNRGFHSGELFTEGMRWLWFFLMAVPFLLAYTGYLQWRKVRK